VGREKIVRASSELKPADGGPGRAAAPLAGSISTWRRRGEGPGRRNRADALPEGWGPNRERITVAMPPGAGH
jgi:hypothetical protein